MTKGQGETGRFQEQVGKLQEVRGKEKINTQIGCIMEHLGAALITQSCASKGQ